MNNLFIREGNGNSKMFHSGRDSVGGDNVNAWLTILIDDDRVASDGKFEKFCEFMEENGSFGSGTKSKRFRCSRV